MIRMKTYQFLCFIKRNKAEILFLIITIHVICLLPTLLELSSEFVYLNQ
jgi:hypothetical protein